MEKHRRYEVPPIGLDSVDADGDELPQNNGSLKIAEGEEKTVVCKTNAPIKPVVDLEWIIPIGLNVSANSLFHVHDVSDGRLSVPILTLSFTSYVYDEDTVLVCRVDSNSSFEDIRASIYIKTEGEPTTNSRNLWTASKDSHTLTESNGDIQGSGTAYTTPLAASNPDPVEEYSLLVIAGGSAVAIFKIVIACVGGFIRSKKGAVERSAAPAIQTSGNLLVDETSHTSKPKSTSGVKSSDMTFDQSDPTYAIPDVSEVPHTYMALKPTMKRKSPASTRQQVSQPITSVDNHGDAVIYVSPTLVRNQVHAQSNRNEELTYVNSEAASTYSEIGTDIPKIVEDYTDQLDFRNAVPDFPEVPSTYMAMKPILKCKSPASTSQHVSHPTTSVDDHGDTDIPKIVKGHTDGPDDVFTTYL